MLQIPESELRSECRSKLTGALGIDLRKPLALIDPLDQFLVLHITQSYHPRSAQNPASILNMLEVESLSG